MAWTQADIDTLDQAIRDRQFARAIAFSDQTVTFESLEDMWKLRDRMVAEVNITAGIPRSRTRYAATSKGA
jgi:hypothetical protein